MSEPSRDAKSGTVLVCDAGTSRVKLGLFANQNALPRTLTIDRKDFPGQVAQVRQWLREIPLPLDGCVLASGPAADVPLIQQTLQEIAGSACDLLSRTTPLPFASRYAEGQAGIDRLANAAAAFHPGHFPAIVVDAGTAITMDILDAAGQFLGGAILPGPALQSRALHQGTAALPCIDFSGVPAPVGSNTDAAIASGLVHGCAGAVERLLRMSQENVGQATVTITGGWGKELADLLEMPEKYDPFITLRGIRALWRYSR